LLINGCKNSGKKTLTLNFFFHLTEFHIKRFATYSEIFQSEFKEDRSFLYILEDLNIETIEDKFFSYLKTAGDTLITININRRPMTEEKSFRKAYYYIEMGEYPALTLKKEYLKNFSESFVNS
jgi:hypothetical protein